MCGGKPRWGEPRKVGMEGKGGGVIMGQTEQGKGRVGNRGQAVLSQR